MKEFWSVSLHILATMADASKDLAEQPTKGSTEEAKNEVFSLDGWSARVEDLIDKEDEDGAVKLLENVVAKLSLTQGSSTNLGLAAALNDLGGLYSSRGLSLKADSLFSEALLIKKTAEGAPHGAPDSSWEDIANKREGTQFGDGAANIKGELQAIASDADRAERVGTPSTTGLSDEEDWESAVPSLLATPASLSPAVKKPEPIIEKDTSKQKQRGRGSFTYGGAGLYSDYVEEDSAHVEGNERVDMGGASDHWDGGADHVLLIDGFTPLMKTKDLEILVKPYSSQGVTIRWVDDSTVLAVFRTPALARQALAGIHDPRFKISKYTDATAVLGHSISLSLSDLEPPAPRPATNARVAQRMIAGALSRQGLSHNLRAKNQATAEQAQIQEAERKQRLLNRQQLRDEAWGDN